MKENKPKDILENGWNITAFGASVTEQNFSYIEQLGGIFKSELGRCAYGGDSLKDAGVIKIDKVLEMKPTHCFIDWFSSAYVDTNQITIDCLETIVHKFSNAECKLIFLFLPRKDNAERINFYEFVKEFLVENNLFFIDLTQHIDWTEVGFTDVVHPRWWKSTEYASVIYDIFMEHEKDIKICNKNFNAKYSEIKSINVSKTTKKEVVLVGNCEVVGFQLKVGRHSGLVRVNNELIVNTWDPWCHFTRTAYKINNLAVNGETTLEILQDEFDTSECRRQRNYSNYKKYLEIENIFYVGEHLECHIK